MELGKKTLVLFASPRAKGYTRQLLRETLAPFAIDSYEELSVQELQIGSCRGCGACDRTRCPQQDDMERVFQAIDRCELLIVAAPVYFSGVPGPLKDLIDRCQPRWAQTYGRGCPPVKSRTGLILAVKGSEYTEEMQGYLAPLRQFMNLFGARDAGFFYAAGTDEDDTRIQTAASEAGRWLREEI